MEDCARRAFYDSRMRFGRGPGDQQVLPGRDDPLRDGRDLRRGLAWAEDDLGKTLPNASMVVDAGEPEVLERRVAQELKEAGMRGLRRQGAGLHLFEEAFQLESRHCGKRLSRR